MINTMNGDCHLTEEHVILRPKQNNEEKKTTQQLQPKALIAAFYSALDVYRLLAKAQSPQVSGNVSPPLSEP